MQEKIHNKFGQILANADASSPSISEMDIDGLYYRKLGYNLTHSAHTVAQPVRPSPTLWALTTPALNRRYFLRVALIKAGVKGAGVIRAILKRPSCF